MPQTVHLAGNLLQLTVYPLSTKMVASAKAQLITTLQYLRKARRAMFDSLLQPDPTPTLPRNPHISRHLRRLPTYIFVLSRITVSDHCARCWQCSAQLLQLLGFCRVPGQPQHLQRLQSHHIQPHAHCHTGPSTDTVALVRGDKQEAEYCLSTHESLQQTMCNHTEHVNRPQHRGPSAQWQ